MDHAFFAATCCLLVARLLHLLLGLPEWLWRRCAASVVPCLPLAFHACAERLCLRLLCPLLP
eukprot:11562647-Prorocentrum_lima.AAC.1